jgi:diguanylate cyclase (GGDEF)-like protein
MNNLEPQSGADSESHPSTEYSLRLRALQRREWWTWGFSLIVILVLTGAVASFSFPAIFEGRKSALSSGVLQAVSGLVLLIILFVCYLTYEKILINRLRRELAEKQFHSTVWRSLALVDPLTGLYNRRFAERRLKEEISRSQRKGYALILVLFDLNNFKQINDRFGHAAGDQVLKEFAGRLSKTVREADMAARIGGDEFMWLVSECESSQLPFMIRRLEIIEVNLDGQRIPVEFSVGWATYERGQQPRDLFEEADKALYQHKQSSKALVSSHVE